MRRRIDLGEGVIGRREHRQPRIAVQRLDEVHVRIELTRQRLRQRLEHRVVGRRDRHRILRPCLSPIRAPPAPARRTRRSPSPRGSRRDRPSPSWRVTALPMSSSPGGRRGGLGLGRTVGRTRDCTEDRECAQTSSGDRLAVNCSHWIPIPCLGWRVPPSFALTRGIRCDVTHGWTIARSVTFASHLSPAGEAALQADGAVTRPDASQWFGE